MSPQTSGGLVEVPRASLKAKKRRRTRTVARPIGGGGVYSYVRVLPDGFLLKAIVFTVCEHECMNIPPPPPQLSCLATALRRTGSIGCQSVQLRLGILLKMETKSE